MLQFSCSGTEQSATSANFTRVASCLETSVAGLGQKEVLSVLDLRSHNSDRGLGLSSFYLLDWTTEQKCGGLR